ncbi:hypothetical protein [Pseudarthrobacter sp. NS4]|uniref:hypothetical protein n=1 Tax=Pseudarthrobacter sp. NS4 TaxID=2973976 RepID=UPI002162F705|nr:hypothetical protein [Pseudarthrobacter sp. NS4]
MGSLKISSTALDAAGGVLAQASGFLGDASRISVGDAGYSRLVAKGQETATAWQSAIGPLTEAVTIDGKQCIAAGQEFGRVDEALTGALAGGKP